MRARERIDPNETVLGYPRIAPTPDAQEQWVRHVLEAASSIFLDTLTDGRLHHSARAPSQGGRAAVGKASNRTAELQLAALRALTSELLGTLAGVHFGGVQVALRIRGQIVHPMKLPGAPAAATQGI
jgi:hypothetical protein